MIGQEEKLLCRMLDKALNGMEFSAESEQERNLMNRGEFIQIAQKHKVLPVLYDLLQEQNTLTGQQLKTVQTQTRRTVQQSYRLLFLTKYVVSLLEENHIETVVLKGAGAAVYYPVPEYRKSGDVDLLILANGDAARAGEVLEKAGFLKKEEQHAHHHLVYRSWEGIDVELHTMLAEPFDNDSVNRYLDGLTGEFISHSVRKDIMGIALPVPGDGDQAFHLLLHMLQHFLRSGFGLKLLCDWTAFWNHPVSEEEKEIFLKFVRESGTEGFSRIITEVCVQYLGLKKENVEFLICGKEKMCDLEEFLEEVLEAEEFGKSSSDRMVAMRGTRLTDYIREFRHQVKLTYPKSSKYVFCLPVLWGMMLAGFFYRNHTLRRVSSLAVLKKARKRSKMMNEMGLFGGKKG